MPFDDWIDRKQIQQFTRHSSAFITCLFLTAVARIVLWFVQWVSILCGEPIHEQVIFLLYWADDLLLLFFTSCLIYRVVRAALTHINDKGGHLMIVFGLLGVAVRDV